jgi:hypothetical protein
MSEIIEFPNPTEPRKVTSYDLMAVASALTAFVMALEEDPTPEQVDWFNEHVFGLAEDVSEKLRNIRYVLKDHIAKAEFIRREEVLLAKRRKRISDSIERLERTATELLQASAEVTGERKVQWYAFEKDDEGRTVRIPMGSASLRTSKRAPPFSKEELVLLRRRRPDLVSRELVYKLDKVAYKADVKAGRVDGEIEEHEYIHFT